MPQNCGSVISGDCTIIAASSPVISARGAVASRAGSVTFTSRHAGVSVRCSVVCASPNGHLGTRERLPLHAVQLVRRERNARLCDRSSHLGSRYGRVITRTTRSCVRHSRDCVEDSSTLPNSTLPSSIGAVICAASMVVSASGRVVSSFGMLGSALENGDLTLPADSLNRRNARFDIEERPRGQDGTLVSAESMLTCFNRNDDLHSSQR
jgi:hypothetical protein